MSDNNSEHGDWEDEVAKDEDHKDLKKALDDAMKANKVLTQKNNTLETEKNEALSDLATVTSQLEDEKALTKDLLLQLDQDTATAAQAKRKSIMVLMDESRAAIRPYLSDKYNWTICTFADDITEINALLKVDDHVKEITSHDMVILSCGRSHISKGESGRQVAEDLSKLASDLTNLTGLEICVLAIPPTRARPGQALLCNMKLEDLLKDVTGVSYLPLTTLMGTDKSTTVSADNTLTPAGGKALAEILNDLSVTGTKRMPKKDEDNDDEKSDDDKENKKGSKENKEKKKGSKEKDNKKPNTSSSSEQTSDDDDDDEELLSEEITIKHAFIGPIIGRLGSRIQSLRAKTGAMISVFDGQKEGKKRSKIMIKGKRQSVQAACYEVNKIIQQTATHPKPDGSSPNPKKTKN